MKQRKKVLNKFRKKSVAFPIILFFVVILFTVIAGIMIITAELGGLFQSKLFNAKELVNVHAENIIKQLNSDKNNIQEIINREQNKVFILDNNEIKYSNCDTIELVKLTFAFDDDMPIKVYVSKNEYGNVDSLSAGIISESNMNSSITFNVFQIFAAMQNAESEDVLYDLNAWIAADEKINDSDILIFTNINLKRKDILFTTLLIGTVGVLICVVALIMFINIFRSAHSNNKMLKALYFDDKTLDHNWLYLTTKSEKLIKNRKYCYAVLSIKCCKYEHYHSCSGLEVADEIFQKTFLKIKSLICKTDLIARNSDTNFGIVLKRFTMEELKSVIEKIVAETDEQIYVGAYILSYADKFNIKNNVVEEFYHYAKIACDSIQDAKESCVAYFDDKLKDEHLWLHKVENQMEAALENEEFVVYIQPKYDPKTSTLKGAEALIRWISPTDGFISPGKFIPIFEQNGFITKIDDYMISKVAKLQADWIAQGFQVVPVSVNVSRVHFIDPNLAEHICELVDKCGTPHNVIEIELTESAFFDDKKALLSTVEKLQNLGFHVSMDDFGSGYSSLNSLKDLSLNVLKLDAEFFRGEAKENRGEIIVEKAIELAKKLNMEIVAEGVEQKEQVEFLAKLDCDMIQGFYFDKPLPTNEFETRMKK